MIGDTANNFESAFLGRGPADCPWYVAAIMALHYALGLVLVLAGIIMLVAVVLDAAFHAAELELLLVGLALVAALVMGIVGLLMLYSGHCVRRRELRRYSILCGSLWFFGGPLAVVGLLTLVGLSRRRAIDYYESAVEAPAFPVVPTVGR